MGAVLSTLATIGLSLGISEAGKLVDRVGLTPAKAAQIANEIIAAAEKKGSAMLNKAMNAIQAIPSIASSPAVKEHLIKARNTAMNNYTKVEQDVTGMKTKASNTAATVQDLGNQGVIQKGFNFIAGNSNRKQAETLRDTALSNIEQPVQKGE